MTITIEGDSYELSDYPEGYITHIKEEYYLDDDNDAAVEEFLAFNEETPSDVPLSVRAAYGTEILVNGKFTDSYEIGRVFSPVFHNWVDHTDIETGSFEFGAGDMVRTFQRRLGWIKANCHGVWIISTEQVRHYSDDPSFLIYVSFADEADEAAFKAHFNGEETA